MGTYVEDLSGKDLQINVLKGDVNLKNLRLKRTSLDEISHLIPLQVLRGSIGHIKLKVNFKKLIKSPIVVEVSDVVIVVCSRHSEDYNHEREDQSARLALKTQLQTRLNKQIKGLKSFKKQAKRSSSKSKSFRKNAKKSNANEKEEAEESALAKVIKLLKSFHSSPVARKLIETVVKNITISIHNVHVRYEEVARISSKAIDPVIFSVTLKSLQMFSCDDQWERIHMSSSKGPCYKKIKLEDLAVYTSKHNPYSGATFDDDQAFSKRMLSEIEDNNEDKEYLLHPSSVLAKFVMFLQKPDPDRPRIQATVNMENLIRLEFNDHQYRSVLNTASYFLNFRQYERYRALRPPLTTDLSTSEGRLVFWKFILQCLRKNVQQTFSSKERLKQRQEDQKQYIALIKKRTKASSSLASTFSSSNKRTMESIEQQYEFDDLAFWQDIAFREMEKNVVKKPNTLRTPNETMQTGSEFEIMTAVTDSDMQELYNTLEFDENEEKMIQESMQGRKFSEVEVDLHVHHIDIAIHRERYNERLISILCSSVAGGMILQSDLTIEAQSSIKSVCISSTKGELILSNMTKESRRQSLKDELIHLEMKRTPNNIISIMARVDPVEFVVPLPTNIQQIASFALVDPRSSDVDINSLIASFQAVVARSNAQNALKEAGEMAQQTMRAAMKKQTIPILNVDIEMASSRVVIAAAAAASSVEKIPAFVVDLSTIKIQNEKESSSPRTASGQEKKKANVQNFTLSLSEANVSTRSEKTLPLISLLPQPINTTVHLTITSDSDDESIPLASVDVQVSPIEAKASMQTVRDVVTIATSYLPVIYDLGGRVENSEKILSAQNVALNAPFNTISNPWVSCDIDLKSACCVVVRKPDGSPHSIIWLRNAIIQDISQKDQSYFDQEVEHVVKVALPRLSSEQLFFFAFPSEIQKKNWMKEMKILALSSKTDQNHQFDTMMDVDEDVILSDDTVTTYGSEIMTTTSSQNRSSVRRSISTQLYAEARKNYVLHASVSSMDVSFEASPQMIVGLHVSDVSAEWEGGQVIVVNEATLSVAKVSLSTNGNEIIKLINANPNSGVISATVYQSYNKEITDAPPFVVSCQATVAPIDVQLTQNLVHNMIPVGVEALDILDQVTGAKVNSFSALDLLSNLSEMAYSGTNALSVKIDGNVESVKISVLDNGHDFIQAQARDLNLNIQLEQSTLFLSGNVNGLEAMDVSEPSLPFTIITTDNEQTPLPFVEFRISQSLDNAVADLSSPFYLRTLSATVRPLRFVVNMLFMRRLLLFAFEGVVWRKSLSSLSEFSLGALIAKFMQPGLRKLHLDINIISPTVVIPDCCDVSSSKQTSFSAMIDKISISNRLHEVFIYSNNWREELQLSVTGIKMSSFVGKGSLVTPLLHPFDIQILLDKSAVLPNIPEMPKLIVSVECQKVNVTMSHLQYQILWRVLNYNVKRFSDIKTQFAIDTSGLMQALKTTPRVNANAMPIVSFPPKKRHEKALNDIETKLSVSLPRANLTLRRGTGRDRKSVV